MDILLRVLLILLNVVSLILTTILKWFVRRQEPTFPPIKNKLLLKPLNEVVLELRQKKLTSYELVSAYIERIREVNPSLNAVVEDRFTEALKEAEHADQLIAKAPNLVALYARYPLLGLPFSVKESCGVKGLSFAVGSLSRKYEKCPNNGDVVEQLRAAGCIPLLVSANPEFCMSFETNTHTNGRCLNPYDLNRTSAGSSGGEGALNGAGATLFGLGSDIGGSIRLPALFCGVFGHKPTGGLLSCQGHFPFSPKDENFGKFLQLGPISRFARDLPILLQIMAGDNAEKLKFDEGVKLKDLKIYYAYGFDGFNGLTHPPVALEIQLAIMKAVKCFEKGGVYTEEAKIKNLNNSIEMAIAGLVTLKGIPSIITHSSVTKPSTKVLIYELIKCAMGQTLFTKEALFMELMISLNGLMSKTKIQEYKKQLKTLREELLQLLGTDGVLFFPTFHKPAFHFNTSILNLGSIDLMILFNILGFPATHVPMGLTKDGLPIGFQVIAAPYQDRLCLQIAAELEGAFGGWVPPVEHNILS